MAARRYVSQPTPLCSPKSSLTPSNYSAVDAVLKDLKACTRKIQTALASQQTELQILEKLMYKGNNQHRHALFWRRVSDVRRFARRLQEMQVLDTVEVLRHSFWDNAQQGSKALKSAWTHLPDVETVRKTVNRLHDYLTFANSMDLHMTKAYNHLVLDLKTGAFLQLILTLVAIISRIGVLLSDIGYALEQAWTAGYRLHLILDPSQDFTPRMVDGRFKTIRPEFQPPTSVQQTIFATTDVDEDIGSSIPQPLETQQGVKTPSLDDVPETVALSSNEQDFMFSGSTADERIVARTVVSRKETKIRGGKKLKRSSAGVVEEERDKAKKKKKKKDEIDDIFGF